MTGFRVSRPHGHATEPQYRAFLPTGPLFLVLFLCFGQHALSAPYHGDEFTYTQPDGSRFQVRLYGDEFYAVQETVDGHVIVRDTNTGFFCYATLRADQRELVPALGPENRVGRADPRKLGLTKHIRITGTARMAKVRAGQNALGVDRKGRPIRRNGKRPRTSSSAPDTDAVAVSSAPAPDGGEDAPPVPGPPASETTGDRIGLVLLVRFPDRPEDVVHSQPDVDAFCNQPGYSMFGNKGSVYDFFYQQSGGKLRYTSIVTAYYTATNTKSFYDDPTKTCGGQGRLLATEALTHLRDVVGFDFSKCDGDGDSWVDGINLLYAGSCSSPWMYGLWPHKSSVNFAPGDGMNSGFQSYQCTDMDTSLVRGTYCHENGHMICKFPDLYDYGYESYGSGRYSIMSYSGNPNPPNVDPYLKYKAGWTDIIAVNAASHVRASVAVDRNLFYRYVNPTNAGEYFIIETRQRLGYEEGTSLPDDGLLVWHIDEEGSNNNEQRTPDLHYEASVEQADGLYHLENDANNGGPGDLFHAGYQDAFSDASSPDAHWWPGDASGLDIHSISTTGPSMTFVVGNGVPSGTPHIRAGTSLLTPVCDYGTDAPSQNVLVWNEQGGSLTYSITTNVDWLSVSPATGTCSSAAGLISVSYSSAALPPGTTNAAITITSPDADNSPQTVFVELTVREPPVLALSTSVIVRTLPAGTSTNEPFEISNPGAGTLNYAISADQPWLTVSTDAGTAITEIDIIHATLDASTLSNAVYNGTITITSPNATNPLETIAVQLTVEGWTGAGMDVRGNNAHIANGSSVARSMNNTDFGYVDESSGSCSHDFTIHSIGVSNLYLVGTPLVAVSGPHSNDFTVTQFPSDTMTPGTSSVFSILFDPNGMGARSATVTIANNDNSVNPYSFTIRGYGATLRYVSPSGGHAAPYTSWTDAATNIQAAIDVSSSNCVVLVTNGVYDTGSVVIYGSMMNRIAITNAVTVKSVNGPSVTHIVGNSPKGDAAVRCAYVGDGASLIGFTLTNGATRTAGDIPEEQSGGGVWCGTDATVADCVISGNTADNYGGGSYHGNIRNCFIRNNSASTGGGTYYGVIENCAISGNAAVTAGGCYYSTVRNCTVAGNSASSASGGVRGGTIQNTIVYYNDAPDGPNWTYGTYAYTFSTPLPDGPRNATNAPGLLGPDNPHLVSASPCVDAGLSPQAPDLPDIDGEERIQASAVDVGCDEFSAGSITGALALALNVDFTRIARGADLAFEALITGRANTFEIDFGDGQVLTNGWESLHSYGVTGRYDVVLSAWNDDMSCAVTTTIYVLPPTNYVSPAGSHAPPFASWLTAANDIQSAIDVAAAGAVILVSNGTYNAGGVVVHGSMTNRIAITNAVTVRSVHGPSLTHIVGNGPKGDSAVRCAYVGNGASLIGFTLTNGATRMSGDIAQEQSGGGAWCEPGGTVRDCVISGNTADNNGGGTYYGNVINCFITSNSSQNGGGTAYGVIENCAISGNAATYGGGCYFSTVRNCTVSGNSASTYSGGIRSGTIQNSIVYYNDAPDYPNWRYGTYSYTFTTPLPSGTGNATNIPGLPALDNPHLVAASPCINTGLDAQAPEYPDIDGEQRIWGAAVDVGCDEFHAGSITGSLSAALSASVTRVVPGTELLLTAAIAGKANTFEWNFGDGYGMTNATVASHSYGTTGQYQVVLTAWNDDMSHSVTTTVYVLPATNYVSPAGSHSPPFADWSTAANDIQSAIEAAAAGAVIMVTNGIYDTGGVAVFGAMTNRIAITNVLTVRSVNGPSVTHIVGNGPRGDSAVRCAYVAAGARLAGFTLRDGYTRNLGDTGNERSGGGAWCETGATIDNCTVTGCEAAYYGGGIYRGTVERCLVYDNYGWNCGGVYSATISSSVICSNTAGYGGGLRSCTARGCTVYGNSASQKGPGTYYGTMENCIIWGNSPSNYAYGSFEYSCTTPLPAGDGNIDDDPLFMDPATLDLRLTTDSPCVDAGTNLAWTTNAFDFDGHPRIMNITVDMGAYEMTNVVLLVESVHGGIILDGAPVQPGSTVTNNFGLMISCAVTNSPYAQGTTQYVCTGWSITGHEPGNGSSTNIAMLHTNDAVLTWRWDQTNYWLDTGCGPNGSVDKADQWVGAGSNITVTALASNYCHFVTWSGTVQSTENPLTLTMDRPHSLTAEFQVTLVTNNTPQWWLAQYGLGTNDADAVVDSDGDGHPNWQEYYADTIPTNPESVLRLTGLQITGTSARVSWKGGILARQYLECREDLSATSGQWRAVYTNDPNTPVTNLFIDPGATNTHLFYRVRVQMP